MSDVWSRNITKYYSDSQEFDTGTFYRAKVADTNDPMGLGRVRVRVTALHGVVARNSEYLKDNELPWATPACLLGGGNDCGQFIIPAKGTTVFVFFENHNVNKPIYFGGIPSIIGDTKYYNDNPEVFKGAIIPIVEDDRIKDIKNGSEQIVYKSLKGATIIIDDKDNAEYISIIDAAGQRFTMSCVDSNLPRRGDNTSTSYPFGDGDIRSYNVKTEIDNGQGDSIVITPGKIKVKTKTFEVDADNIKGI